MLRPGQMETVSSPQIVCNLIGFPSHSSYSSTLRANVMSTAMPEAERLKSFGTCDFHRQLREVAEGCSHPVLVPRQGPVQRRRRSGAGAGPCSHCRAPAAGEPEGSPVAPGAGVPTGNAFQIALCLSRPCKLAMWEPKRCRGQLRSLRTRCSHKDVLSICA